jgi:cytochrome c peroxidase
MPRIHVGKRRAFGALAAGVCLVAVTAEGLAGEGSGRSRPAPREEARIELGRRLFFDPRVSRAGMRACADCHDPEHGYGDPVTRSRDDRGPTRRHTQPILDAADNPSAHWDGAFRRIEDLVTARVTLSHRGGVSLGHEFMGGVSRQGLALADRGARRLDGDLGGSTPDGTAGRVGPVTDRPSGQGTEGDDASDSGGDSSDEDKRKDEPAYAPAGRQPAGATTPGERTPSDPPAAAAPEAAAPSSAPPAPSAPSDPAAAAPSAPPSVAGPDAGPASPPGKEGTKLSLPEEDPFVTPPDADAERLEFLHHDLEVSTLPLADRLLEAAGRYKEAFAAAFGSPDVTIARIADAIAAYCRTIRTGMSAYDRFACGDAAAMTASAKRGLDLFRGKGSCASCHTMAGPRAAFTDYELHDTGVEWNALPAGDLPAREAAFDAVGDGGALTITGRPRHLRAFKTPTLRDAARRAPFFHDGSARTLEDAIRHYERPTSDPAADPALPRVDFSEDEVRDLAAFLRALTSDERPGLAPVAWRERAGRTRLAFADADGAPLADLPVRLVPAGDRLPGAPAGPGPIVTLRTDEDGEVAYTPPAWTHARLVLPDGVASPDGALVPDTCRKARVRVAVRGTVRLWLTLPASVAPPATVVADHMEATLFPDRRRPRTVFRALARTDAGGASVTLYRAFVRTDVPPRVALRLPVPRWGVDRLRMTIEADESVRLDLTR